MVSVKLLFNPFMPRDICTSVDNLGYDTVGDSTQEKESGISETTLQTIHEWRYLNRLGYDTVGDSIQEKESGISETPL